MGEPSLWNEEVPAAVEEAPAGFNPSWESRPSGTYADTKSVCWL